DLSSTLTGVTAGSQLRGFYGTGGTGRPARRRDARPALGANRRGPARRAHRRMGRIRISGDDEPGLFRRDRCTCEAVQRAPHLVQAAAAGAASVVPADGDPSTTAGRLALVGHR